MSVLPAHGPTHASAPGSYAGRLTHLAWEGIAQVIRPASHSRRAEAARAWARFTLVLSAVAALIIVALMLWLDAAEITWMPPRGTASLWPLRVITDFGKAAYVISFLFVAMIALLLLAPRPTGVAQNKS